MIALQISFRPVIFAWLITQLLILNYFGIYTEEEAEVYINIANEILQGNFDHSLHYWLYSGYISILIFIKFLGLPVQTMYLIQATFSLVSLFCFKAILKRLPIPDFAAILACFFLATSPVFHAWNSHIYTDGLFGSLVVIGLYLINRSKEFNAAKYLGAILFLFFVSFVRPVGFLILILALIYFIIERFSFRRILPPFLGLLFMIWFVQLSLRKGTDFFYPNHNLELNVICGYPSDLQKFETTPFDEGMTLSTYFFKNPALTTMLAFQRAYKSLWMTRPYFSNRHNFMLGAVCLFYYLFALVGIISVFRKKNKKYNYFIIATFIWLVPNILFCADWHNRFIVPLIPGLLTLASFGLAVIGSLNFSNKFLNNIKWVK